MQRVCIQQTANVHAEHTAEPAQDQQGWIPDGSLDLADVAPVDIRDKSQLLL